MRHTWGRQVTYRLERFKNIQMDYKNRSNLSRMKCNRNKYKVHDKGFMV